MGCEPQRLWARKAHTTVVAFFRLHATGVCTRNLFRGLYQVALLHQMPSFALRCQCDATIRVGIAQAGGSVRCPSCGLSLEVPSTKVLRNLPQIDGNTDGVSANGLSKGESLPEGATRSRGPKAADSALQRILPALLLAIAAVSLTTAAVLGWARWNSPIEFGHTEEEFFAAFRDDAMQDPPARVWDHWKYLVDTGLPAHQPPDYFVINEFFERRKPWLIGSSILGALSLALFVMMTLQQAKSRSQ